MKVNLKNVGVIKECDVEFVPGINLIVGSSGSGKSTLLRCIYNMASNGFSDSDISFGSQTMNVVIKENNDVVEYSRSPKAKGDKCYYKVNGETYVKLGRTALKQVSDILKINDINVNGDEVNFNFNLQFSSPFLILGSQSTLYNVLTYRSNFDISSINEYYIADVKSNASEIVTNTKVKERLVENLNDLNKEAEKLKSIEEIYSDYVSCKHRDETLKEIKILHEKLTSVLNISEKLSEISECISHIEHSINIAERTIDIQSYSDKHSNSLIIKENFNNVSKTIEMFCKCYKDIETLTDIKKAKEIADGINNSSKVIKSCSYKSDILNKEQLVYDCNKSLSNLKEIKKCKSLIEIGNYLSSSSEDNISDISIIKEIMISYNNTKKKSLSVIEELNTVNKELGNFNVCPLCGNHLC